jgi:DNA-binding transcriptional LysR family regulator
MVCEAVLHNAAVSSELFTAIAAFARVAHHASFTRAALDLGVSPSALSQTLRSLESRLGVRLLDRSTRRVAVTEAGQRLLQDAEPGLAALRRAIEAINETRDTPSGLLRLNLSRTACDIVVMPHLADFLQSYPDITLELQCDNALLDVIASGCDAGIRLGENLAQDVVAVPLGGRHRLATVAAPRYLQGRTPPHGPDDLQLHHCLNVRLSQGLYRWEYAQAGREFDIAAPGPLISNDGDVVLAAARAGAGIACAFEALVQADITAGRLVPLLEDWWPSFPGFYLYFPSRLHLPRKLRVFIDFMQARLNG